MTKYSTLIKNANNKIKDIISPFLSTNDTPVLNYISNLFTFPLIIFLTLLFCYFIAAPFFYHLGFPILFDKFLYISCLVLLNLFLLCKKYILTEVNLVDKYISLIEALTHNINWSSITKTIYLYFILFGINTLLCYEIGKTFFKGNSITLGIFVITTSAILLFTALINTPTSDFIIARRKFFIYCIAFVIAFSLNIYNLSKSTITSFETLAYFSTDYLGIIIALLFSFNQIISNAKLLVKLYENTISKKGSQDTSKQ